MQSDDEPVFDAAVTDLEGQQQRGLFAPNAGHRGRPWGVGMLLLLLLLVGGELAWAARPLIVPSYTGHATPSLSVAALPTPVNPAVFTVLAAHPLQFPVVTSLASCPVAFGKQISSNFGLAAGTGPLYIVGVDGNGNVDYVPAAQWGADHLGWGGMSKTLWIFPTTFSGPVLVRGQRLDSAGAVRFNEVTGPLLAQLQIMVPMEAIAPPFAPPYQEYGSWYIRFNAPGCYGLQIDWSQGTEWIIFRAEAGQGSG